MITYRDQELATYQAQYRSLFAGENPEATVANIQKLRLSEDKNDQFSAAVGYAEMAQWLDQKGEQRPAAEALHFAGHLFRVLGNSNKAATAYELSFDLGAKSLAQLSAAPEKAGAHLTSAIKQLKFDLRSIRRACNLYSDAGQFNPALRSRLKASEAERDLAYREQDTIKYATWTLWKIGLGYNYSWPKTGAVAIIGAILIALTPLKIGLIIGFTTTCMVLGTMLRRFT